MFSVRVSIQCTGRPSGGPARRAAAPRGRPRPWRRSRRRRRGRSPGPGRPRARRRRPARHAYHGRSGSTTSGSAGRRPRPPPTTGPRGTAATRWLTMGWRTTTSQPRADLALGRSIAEGQTVAARPRGTAAPHVQGRFQVDHGRQRLVVDDHQLGGVRPCPGSRPPPRRRARPRSGPGPGQQRAPISRLACPGSGRRSTSGPATTATTPGAAAHRTRRAVTSGVRHGGAHVGGVHCPCEAGIVQVGYVAAALGQQARVLDAADPVAQDAHGAPLP